MANLKSKNSSLGRTQACNNVLEFYLLTTKLKELIRTGWKHWNVDRERLESVAEHVYGVSMLAIAMNSEFYYEIDISRVIMMIAVHELEEIEISDITPFQGISAEDKKIAGHKAIRQILSPLIDSDCYVSLIEEFDERESNEAKFAYQCDKLEADLMAIKYDNESETTYENASIILRDNKDLKALAEKGAKTMSEFFCFYDRSKYDDNFRAVLENALNERRCNSN